jgi:large subunit ribosomal protein L23
MNIAQTLIRPVMTEKSVGQEAINKFTFVVHDDATKIDVKNALMSLYGVEVAKVNILHTLPKYRMGKGKNLLEKRQGNRRAIVTLKEGSKLDLTREVRTEKKETPKPAKAKTAAATK